MAAAISYSVLKLVRFSPDPGLPCPQRAHSGHRPRPTIPHYFTGVPVSLARDYCGGQMKVVAFITDYGAVDRIIDHLKLTFVAAKPPPCHVFEQVALRAVEVSGE